jgi:hypothetical protein
MLVQVVNNTNFFSAFRNGEFESCPLALSESHASSQTRQNPRTQKAFIEALQQVLLDSRRESSLPTDHGRTNVEGQWHDLKEFFPTKTTNNGPPSLTLDFARYPGRWTKIG